MRSLCPLSRWLALLLALGLAGCGSGSGGSSDDVTPTPTTVVAPVASPTPVEVAAGALDPSFGTNGLALVEFQRDASVVRRGLRVLPDGATELLVLDVSDLFLPPVVHLVLVSADGRSVETQHIGTAIAVEAAAFDSTGDVWIAGTFAGARTVTRVPRLSDGASEPHAPLALATIGDLVPLPGGGVLAFSATDTTTALQRFTADGGVDTTFGTGGVLLVRDRTADDVVGTSYVGVAVAPDGRIFLGGTEFREGLAFFPIVRAYQPSGAPVAGFGRGGFVVIEFVGTGGGVLAMPNGDVVLGTMQGRTRLGPTGALDAEWTARAANVEQGPTTVGPDGDLVTTGSTFVPDEPRRLDCSASSGGVCLRQAWTVSRILPDGTPDARFGGIGTVVTDTPEPYGAEGTGFGPAVLAPAGRITIAGAACRAPLDCDVAVARYVDVAD